MTKILGTLVVAVLVGLGAGSPEPNPQPYKEYEAALINATKQLVVNIISMEDNIPLLNDLRRHYAEIVHVVNFIAQKQTIYPYYPYNEVYYKFLNTSVSDGINNPGNVIAEIRNLLDEVHHTTKELTQFIDNCHFSDTWCNSIVHNYLLKNPEFGVPALIFLAAGRVATEFNKHSGKFDEVSKDLNANQYVCTSPDDLRVLVVELANLYRILNDLPREYDE